MPAIPGFEKTLLTFDASWTRFFVVALYAGNLPYNLHTQTVKDDILGGKEI